MGDSVAVNALDLVLTILEQNVAFWKWWYLYFPVEPIWGQLVMQKMRVLHHQGSFGGLGLRMAYLCRSTDKESRSLSKMRFQCALIQATLKEDHSTKCYATYHKQVVIGKPFRLSHFRGNDGREKRARER